MFKKYKDKIALSGLTVLAIGLALLIFTFVSAYGFLNQTLNINATQDLAQTFGGALSPLIGTCIHIMYLRRHGLGRFIDHHTRSNHNWKRPKDRDRHASNISTSTNKNRR